MIAAAFLACLGLYLAIGLVFAVLFVALGLGRTDPAAKGAPLQVRLILIPGLIGLWPIMALKWLAALPGRRAAE